MLLARLSRRRVPARIRTRLPVLGLAGIVAMRAWAARLRSMHDQEQVGNVCEVGRGTKRKALLVSMLSESPVRNHEFRPGSFLWPQCRSTFQRSFEGQERQNRQKPAN